MWSLVSAMMRPVPAGSAKRSANCRISSHPARALTAKWRSKLSTLVSMIAESTDSQWASTSARTGPRTPVSCSKTTSGADGSARSASMEATRAPEASAALVISSRACASRPQAIRSS